MTIKTTTVQQLLYHKALKNYMWLEIKLKKRPFINVLKAFYVHIFFFKKKMQNLNILGLHCNTTL